MEDDKDDLRADFASAINELAEPSAPEAAPAPPPAEGRDETGRFTPRTPAKDIADATIVAPATSTTAPIPPAPAPLQGTRAPVSWKPEEREGWENLNPIHQQAIIRRDREVGDALRSSAESRQFHQQFQQAIQPYEHMIRAEGADPISAAASLFQTAAILRTAPPLQKAALVADLVAQYGISPRDLDTALEARFRGQPAPSDPMSAIMQQLDQRLAPVNEFMTNLQRRRQESEQQLSAQASQTLDQFLNDPTNEFAEDVAGDMADLLETAAKYGQTLTLQDAYRRATLLHPTVSQVIERRSLNGGVAQQTAAARRARQASASINDSGAPSQTVDGSDEDGDVRSALMASIRQNSNRR